MNRWFWLAIVLASLGLAAWGLSGLTQHIIVAFDHWGNAAPAPGAIESVAVDVKRTLENVNRPCRGAAGPDACGTLAEANKTMVKIGDAIVTTQFQERAVQPHIIEAMDEFGATARHLNSTADAATGLLGTANTALDQLNDNTTGLSPLMRAYLNTGNDVDELLKRKAVSDTLDSVAGITHNIDGVTFDFQRVTHKAAEDYLTPQPWYRKLGRYASDGFDYGALIARHVP